jgi:hypothetical protein
MKATTYKSTQAIAIHNAIQVISNNKPTNKKKLDRAQVARVKRTLNIYNQSIDPDDIGNRMMTFGKYIGHKFKDIPDSYVMWAIDELGDRSTSSLFAKELRRRYP